MHAVVIKVRVKDQEGAERGLQEEVVPSTKQAPGFVNGYWARKGDSGMAMILFDSEEAAQNFSEQVSRPQEQVAVEDVEVREVIAHA
jgi:predicted neutral ceramidase superfamily lipid hydrolase